MAGLAPQPVSATAVTSLPCGSVKVQAGDAFDASPVTVKPGWRPLPSGLLAVTVGAGYAWLGGVLILGTAISIYVYLKIVRAMFVRIDAAHVRDERAANPLPWVTVAVCAAAVFVLGLFPLTPSNVLPLVR
mgnify:CR=1 FL=1